MAINTGYSPEMNPDEQIWNYVKNRIRRGAIETKDELRSRARSLLHSLQKLPDIVAGFFQHPVCQCAA
jgi:transposase